MAATVDFGEELNGAEDAFGSHDHALGAFDDASQGEAKVVFADGEKIEGLGVAVNGAEWDVVVFGDVARAFPVDEFLFDVVTKLVAADGAMGFVGLPGDLGWLAGWRASKARLTGWVVKLSLAGRDDSRKT